MPPSKPGAGLAQSPGLLVPISLLISVPRLTGRPFLERGGRYLSLEPNSKYGPARGFEFRLSLCLVLYVYMRTSRAHGLVRDF